MKAKVASVLVDTINYLLLGFDLTLMKNVWFNFEIWKMLWYMRFWANNYRKCGANILQTTHINFPSHFLNYHFTDAEA